MTRCGTLRLAPGAARALPKRGAVLLPPSRGQRFPRGGAHRAHAEELSVPPLPRPRAPPRGPGAGCQVLPPSARRQPFGMASSALFAPYRTVGLVADGGVARQLHLQTLGGEGFLATSIGRAFQVYRTDHLTISLVSSQLQHAIT